MHFDVLKFILYIIMILVFAAIDLVLFRQSLKHKKRGSFLLGYSCMFAGLANVSYAVSVMMQNYFAVSVLSSLFFLSVDYMFICLLGFAFLIDKSVLSKAEKTVTSICHFWVLADTIILLINPFYEIAVSYEPTGNIMHAFGFRFYPLYHLHMLFIYLMIFTIIATLAVKALKIPAEYRSPYIYNIAGVAAAAFINGFFGITEGGTQIQRIDITLKTYSIIICLFYWSYYKYSSHGLLNKLKSSVFENIDKGMVLFDYNDYLILHNQKADALLGKERFPDGEVSLDSFSDSVNLALKNNSNSNFSLQCYVENEGLTVPMRCDYKRLENSRGKLMGHLMMFSDIALETDILTGFHNWESFKLFAIKNPDQFIPPIAVAIIDINALAVINSSFGRNEGDKRIRELSEHMKKNFPDGTYFVREHEAHLVAICPNCNEQIIRCYVEKTEEDFSGKIQYALNMTDEYNPDIVNAIREASKAMKTKKLLDDSSSHSELISTLVKALEECDNDTEQHVQRTREMGARLGKRIGLSDIQLSNLSLLCLLHDIGKIGIPLEILNKPGKLNEEEWVIMRSHTEKGYQIAASAKELEPIAAMIKHHHERWDGMGYPDGLSKESIPILSRVISVIDSYDAMVNDRIYRPALPVSEALAELKKCAGGQFDPHIVSEFIAMINEEPEAMPETNVVRNEMLREKMENEKPVETVFPVMFSRYVINENSEIIETDDLFENFTGYSSEEVVSKHMTQLDLIPENDRSMYMLAATEQLQNSSRVFFEHHLRKKNGDVILVLCFGEVSIDPETGKLKTAITISNIMHTQAVKTILRSEQDKAQKRLRQWESQYRSDSLTGLMNRSAFESDLEAKMFSGVHRVMMIMIDFDKFKEYNDTYGHSKGDEFLILAAQKLSALIREGDLACRMGGDEFALALFFRKDLSDEKIYSRATHIFRNLSIAMSESESIKFSGVSMGAAISTDEIRAFTQLYEMADACLYEAKKAGRNKIFYNNYTESELENEE